MKEGWNEKPFEDCIEKVTYTQKIQRKDFLDEGAYPVVSQEENFINGYWDNKADLFRVTTPVVVFGDHTKVLKYIDFDFVLGADGVKVLKPRDFLVPKFFYHQLKLANLDSLGYARHYKLLRELEIAYPDRQEQTRIVGILDEAFDGIATVKANAEKNLQSARELFESYLHSVFANPGEDWEEKKLGDVCEIDTGKWNADHAVEGGAYRFYTCAKEYCFSETKRFSGECLILPGNGVNVGDVYYYDGEFDAYQRTYVLSNIKPSARFVYYHMLFYWRSRNLNKQFGSATNFIKIGNFLDYEIPLPSLAGQRTIVAKLDAFSSETGRLEDVYQRKLDTLEDLKRSLLSTAFDGEL